jgi:hypothetical protein
METEAHCRVHKIPPTTSCPDAADPVHNSTPYFLRSILMLSAHRGLCLPSGLFPSAFLTKFLISPIRALCSTHIVLDVITLVIQSVLKVALPRVYSSSETLLYFI